MTVGAETAKAAAWPILGPVGVAVAFFLRRLFRTRFGGIGLIILLAISLAAIFAPWLALTGPMDMASSALQAPSAQHPLGTDSLGRDLYSVILYAGRSSLTIGFCAACMAFLIGGTIGAVAGYVRGPVAVVLLRITDLFHTLPVVLAARSVGLSTPHIIFREILPNALPAVIVQVSLDASIAILIEAGLGFLGLSDPTVPSWGEMLNRGQQFLDNAWWMSVFPGAAIALAVLGFNLFADGLNEMFDPRAAASTPKLQD
jgi:peptide/nickel transport system permease protein